MASSLVSGGPVSRLAGLEIIVSDFVKRALGASKQAHPATIHQVSHAIINQGRVPMPHSPMQSTSTKEIPGDKPLSLRRRLSSDRLCGIVPQQPQEPIAPSTIPMHAKTVEHIQAKGDSESTGASITSISHHRYPSFFVVKVTVIASLGGILFGYDLGVISGALPQLQYAFDLNDRQQELCVSILYLGGGIGAAVGGSLCDACGRKRTILITDAIFAVGALTLLYAANFQTVLAGRIIVGFALALSGIADVTYLNEIAPAHLRGAIVSVNEACISLGFLLAFGAGTLLSHSADGWRVMFGLSGIVAVVQFLGMLGLPESPKWLKQYGLLDECEAAYRMINGGESTFCLNAPVEETYPGSQFTGKVPSSPSAQAATFATTTRTRIHSFRGQMQRMYDDYRSFVISLVRDFRRQSIIALFLAVTQQVCGQANVLSYAPSIFGFFGDNSEWSTLAIGIVKFIVTVIVIWKIDSLGRRFLLLSGVGILALGLLLLTIAFLSHNGEHATAEILAVPGVLLIVCGYSMSFGPLTWLLTAEIFPTEIRGRALGMSTIITYLCACIVTNTFLTAQALFGSSAVYCVYLILTCLGLGFAWSAVPDTGGKTTEEIAMDIQHMPWWLERQRGTSWN